MYRLGIEREPHDPKNYHWYTLDKVTERLREEVREQVTAESPDYYPKEILAYTSTTEADDALWETFYSSLIKSSVSGENRLPGITTFRTTADGPQLGYLNAINLVKGHGVLLGKLKLQSVIFCQQKDAIDSLYTAGKLQLLTTVNGHLQTRGIPPIPHK